MTPLVALVLGVVEGLTEYLPISSTGHLILMGSLLQALGQKSEGSGSFDIVIQLGAVLAVVVQYRTLLFARIRGLLVREAQAMNLLVALVLGFLPAACVGLAFGKAIKRHLFGPLPVAIALAVGGVVMIAVERLRAKKMAASGAAVPLVGLEHVTPKRAFLIGVGQCVSLWPGSSRSMCTILAAQLTGLSTATAAEFSFLLALPTLSAATVYEAYKGRAELLHTGVLNVAIGFVVSFLVAWAVIAGFVKYLQRRGLEPFGYYRIVLGIVVFVTLGLHV